MKIFNKLILTITAFLWSALAFSQENAGIEMADVMMSSGKIYVVVAVLTIIFLGLALYLFLLDRKIGKLESEANQTQ